VGAPEVHDLEVAQYRAIADSDEYVWFGIGEVRRHKLSPNAIYDGVKDPIRIDPSFVEFSVRTEASREIIHVDSLTGEVTAVNIGHALIETSYGGLTTPVCVIVVDAPTPAFTPKAHCSELLAPGEKLRDDVLLPMRPRQ
jgi:hypothetical protein